MPSADSVSAARSLFFSSLLDLDFISARPAGVSTSIKSVMVAGAMVISKGEEVTNCRGLRRWFFTS